MRIVQTKSFQLAINEAGPADSSKLALVLPGKLDTKDYVHMQSHIDFLATQGYYAVSFDPPGTWDSPGGMELYTITNYQKAVRELIELFGNKPTVLLGHSRGGAVALLVGAHHPQVTHMIAVMSPHGPSQADAPKSEDEIVPSLRDLPPGTARTVEHKSFRLPPSYFVDQLQYDAIDGLKTSTKPKLMFYGTDDNMVTPDMVKHMFEASAEPKQLHELATEHDYRLHPAMIEEVNAIVGAFLG